MRVAGNPKSLLARPAITSEFQCSDCGFIGEVRFFAKQGQCIDCHNQERSLHRKPRHGGPSNQEKIDRVRKALVATNSYKSNKGKANSVENLVGHMMNQFGSMEEFTKVWHMSIKQSFAKDPTSWKAMRAMEQVAKLVVDCNRLNPPATSVNELSDEELDAELAEIIADRVRSGQVSITQLATMIDEATAMQDAQTVEGEVR